jgi:hypothetical protein
MTQWYTAYPTAKPSNFPSSSPFPNAMAFNRRMDRFFLCSGSSSADVSTPTATADSGTSTDWNWKSREHNFVRSHTAQLLSRAGWLSEIVPGSNPVLIYAKMFDDFRSAAVFSRWLSREYHGRFLKHPSNSSFRNSQLCVTGHYTHVSALDEE